MGKYLTLLMLFFVVFSCREEVQEEPKDESRALEYKEYSVDLPESTKVSIPDYENTIEVFVDANNRIQINDRLVNLSQVDSIFMSLNDTLSVEQPVIKFSADRTSHFEIFSDIMTLAKEYGYKIVIATK